MHGPACSTLDNLAAQIDWLRGCLGAFLLALMASKTHRQRAPRRLSPSAGGDQSICRGAASPPPLTALSRGDCTDPAGRIPAGCAGQPRPVVSGMQVGDAVWLASTCSADGHICWYPSHACHFEALWAAFTEPYVDVWIQLPSSMPHHAGRSLRNCFFWFRVTCMERAGVWGSDRVLSGR